MVQIPKGNADTRGMGLLEVVWKVVELVNYNRIKTVVQFHDVLHGFRAGRGGGNCNNVAQTRPVFGKFEPSPPLPGIP